MSALASLSDKFRGQFGGTFTVIRKRLFGANNEKLDFFMDSFYKLSPPQRAGVMAIMIGVIAVVVLGAVGLYFVQVGRLKNDMSNSFAALHELQALKASYEVENKNFEKLVDTIQRKTSQTSLKPLFEKIGKDVGVVLEGVNDQRAPLAGDNPLGEKMQEVRIEMRMPNISIPRLLNFLVEVEKSGKYLRVQDLRIQGRYGTKMFFDSQVKVRGYDVGKGG